MQKSDGGQPTQARNLQHLLFFFLKNKTERKKKVRGQEECLLRVLFRMNNNINMASESESIIRRTHRIKGRSCHLWQTCIGVQVESIRSDHHKFSCSFSSPTAPNPHSCLAWPLLPPPPVATANITHQHRCVNQNLPTFPLLLLSHLPRHHKSPNTMTNSDKRIPIFFSFQQFPSNKNKKYFM